VPTSRQRAPPSEACQGIRSAAGRRSELPRVTTPGCDLDHVPPAQPSIASFAAAVTASSCRGAVLGLGRWQLLHRLAVAVRVGDERERAPRELLHLARLDGVAPSIPHLPLRSQAPTGSSLCARFVEEARLSRERSRRSRGSTGARRHFGKGRASASGRRSCSLGQLKCPLWSNPVVLLDNELYTHSIPLPPDFSRSQSTGNGLFKPNSTPPDPHGAGS
jgi:hypothetical protein